MDSEKPSTSKMVKDQRPGAETLRRSNSSSFTLRRDSSHLAYSTITHPDNSQETPKRPKMEDSINGSLNVSEIPGSPWEWRRMKGEVSQILSSFKVT